MRKSLVNGEIRKKRRKKRLFPQFSGGKIADFSGLKGKIHIICLILHFEMRKLARISVIEKDTILNGILLLVC